VLSLSGSAVFQLLCFAYVSLSLFKYRIGLSIIHNFVSARCIISYIISRTRFTDNANKYLHLIIRRFNIFYICSFANFAINIIQMLYKIENYTDIEENIPNVFVHVIVKSHMQEVYVIMYTITVQGVDKLRQLMR
jgi:hypothetical protein